MKSLSTIIATLILLTNLTVAETPQPNHNPQDWPLGIAAWSFKEFSFFDAVEKTAALDLKNIEAYQGQKLYNDSDLKITPDLDDRSITKIKAKLDKHNVTLTSIYIHSIPPDKAEHIFRFCKKLGVKTIVGEPKKEHLDAIEKFCDKYEINLAIHNHATGKSDYSDPKELARLCVDRSQRIGACADTGHWQRSGFDPVECLRILEGRIISVHLKDLNKTEPKGHDVPWGTGKGQIAETLAELNRQKVNPTIIGIEYEHNYDNSTPDIKKCIQFYNKTIAELADQGDLYTGWSQKDITPPGPIALDGQMNLRVATTTLDPITCTALAIETKKNDTSVTQAVMVSCDVAAIRKLLIKALDEKKPYIKQNAPDLDTSTILLNATHTHTAPVMQEGKYNIPPEIMQPTEYCQFAAQKIADAIIEAWNTRKPAAMSWALGQAVVGHNRRCVYSEPYTTSFGTFTAAMYGKTNLDIFQKIEGYEDHGLPLLFFWNPQGELTGMVINICCPSQETEGLRQTSADFWHETRTELRKKLGQNIFIFPQCSAAGDISPHHIWRKPAEVAMQKRKGISQRQEIALRITNAVEQVMPYANHDAKTSLVFKHNIHNIDLPVRSISIEDRDRSLQKANEMKDKKPRMAQWYQRVVDRYETQASDTYPLQFHTIRLGDIALATNSFELFIDYGIQIKARSPAILTFVVQLAGRGFPSTYLPTQTALDGGHYSAVPQSNIVGPVAGRILVNETVQSLQKMWNQ